MALLACAQAYGQVTPAADQFPAAWLEPQGTSPNSLPPAPARSPKGKAVLDQEGKISLVKTDELWYSNVLDISGLHFESEAAAMEYFKAKNTQLVTFRVNFNKLTVNIDLELRAKPSWGFDDWHEYLKGR